MGDDLGRARLLLVLGVLLALTAAAVVVGAVRGTLPRLADVPGLSALPGVGPGSELERAVAMAPADAVRFSWTDWAGVREELALDPPADPSTRDVEELLDAAFDADLSATTALGESAVTSQTALGFSPATLSWELFSQGEEGALVTMGLAEESDAALVEDRLRQAGFTPPEDATGVWRGGPDVLATLGQLSPELSFVAVDTEELVVRASDASAYLQRAVDTDPPEPGQGVADAVGALADAGPPLAAAVYDSAVACESLAMASADGAAQEQARTLLAAAGPVNPLAGFGLGVQPGGDATAALAFETDDQARENADTRARLASGPAPGQGGDFADRFSLGTTAAEGRVVTMELEPTEDARVLSDLSSGPVLFATC